jgi:hypothetical protein
VKSIRRIFSRPGIVIALSFGRAQTGAQPAVSLTPDDMRVQSLKFKVPSFWRLPPVGTMAMIFGGACCACAQGFTNLAFESANLSVIPGGQFGGFVPIASALPGWSGTDGFDAITQVFQNNISGGQVSVDILGPNWQPQGDFQIIAGNYTAVLQAGDATQGHVSATLEQTGLVPGFAKSLLFDAAGSVTGGAFTIAFNNQNLPFVALGAAPNSEEYGVDISAFAGHAGLLSFSDNPVGQNFFGAVLLDNISFSPSPIPEPSTWALLLCGAGLLWIQCPRKNREQS